MKNRKKGKTRIKTIYLFSVPPRCTSMFRRHTHAHTQTATTGNQGLQLEMECRTRSTTRSRLCHNLICFTEGREENKHFFISKQLVYADDSDTCRCLPIEDYFVVWWMKKRRTNIEQTMASPKKFSFYSFFALSTSPTLNAATKTVLCSSAWEREYPFDELMQPIFHLTLAVNSIKVHRLSVSVWLFRCGCDDPTMCKSFSISTTRDLNSRFASHLMRLSLRSHWLFSVASFAPLIVEWKTLSLIPLLTFCGTDFYYRFLLSFDEFVKNEIDVDSSQIIFTWFNYKLRSPFVDSFRDLLNERRKKGKTYTEKKSIQSFDFIEPELNWGDAKGAWISACVCIF